MEPFQTSSTPRQWSVKEIRDVVKAKFGKCACWLQIRIALALYAGKDVVGCARTGAGKTLSFWIPPLMTLEEGRDKMTFVATPLNLLGKQNDIEAGKYQVVVINPKLLMGCPEVEKLWKNSCCTSRILNFIFDEGHCIREWGKFRKEYLHLGDLCYLIPEIIPFYVAPATLPPSLLLDVVQILRL
ncbi:hypothetical protein B0H34DRAFT_669140 [Crassisporium funariophilum]|nr:hypothetical protein B0H34DRAFT_669140 [Crassisporium funariophilum]